MPRADRLGGVFGKHVIGQTGNKNLYTWRNDDDHDRKASRKDWRRFGVRRTLIVASSDGRLSRSLVGVKQILLKGISVMSRKLLFIAVLIAAFTLILGTTESQARGRFTRGYSPRVYSTRSYANYGNRYRGYGYRGYGYRGVGYRGVGVSVGNYGYGGVRVNVGGF
jgi:hypothetical protein